jgi:hypothetical protein
MWNALSEAFSDDPFYNSIYGHRRFCGGTASGGSKNNDSIWEDCYLCVAIFSPGKSD